MAPTTALGFMFKQSGGIFQFKYHFFKLDGPEYLVIHRWLSIVDKGVGFDLAAVSTVINSQTETRFSDRRNSDVYQNLYTAKWCSIKGNIEHIGVGAPPLPNLSCCCLCPTVNLAAGTNKWRPTWDK